MEQIDTPGCAWLSSHEYAAAANGVGPGRAHPGGRDTG
jgi:hypothetical protein